MKTPTVTNRAQFALLGLLSTEPMSGYDVKQWFERALGFFWSESYGQIYPQLRRLVELDYAEVALTADGGRSKKVYSITPSGRRHLSDWLSRPPQPTPQRLEFLLKIFFADRGPAGVCADVLRHERRMALEAQRVFGEITEELESCNDGRPHVIQSLITLRYGMGLAKHTLDWTNDSLKLLELPAGAK